MLDRRIEFQAAPARPGGQPAGDAFIKLAEIMAHRLGLERDRQCLAVDAMLFEIHQHQAAREQQFQHRIPAQFAGKDPVLVEQYKLVGFGPDQADTPATEILAADDRAILFKDRAAAAQRVGQKAQGAQHPEPGRLHAGDVRQFGKAGFGQVGRRKLAGVRRRIHPYVPPLVRSRDTQNGTPPQCCTGTCRRGRQNCHRRSAVPRAPFPRVPAAANRQLWRLKRILFWPAAGWPMA